MSKPRLTYADAGVSVDAGNAFVRRIRKAVASTKTDIALSEIGGFGAFVQAPGAEELALVATTDGVGTKVLLHQRFGTHEHAGRDLVAMCVNDLAAEGARPLFFLDYIACGRLQQDTLARVVEGMAAACREAGCAIVGGETAEMPDLYAEGEYDLAGFAVGVVEKQRRLGAHRVQAGDVVVGFASSGLHANGISLVRKALALSGADPEAVRLADGTLLRDALTEPTRLYVRLALALVEGIEVHALAHITGGGFYDNLARVLPEGLGARIRPVWPEPAVYRWLWDVVDVPMRERYRTFNMGIGFVAIVPEKEKARAMAIAEEEGIAAWAIGEVRGQEAPVMIEGVDG